MITVLSQQEADLLGDLSAIQRGMPMELLALLCEMAESGRGEEAASKLIETVDAVFIGRIARYAALNEDDVVDFYRLGVEIKIETPSGAFWLAPNSTNSGCPTEGPMITPIGLYSLACAVVKMERS